MKPAWRVAAAALPGVVVTVAAALGRPVSGRDLPTYFVPLRERTAAVLAGAHGPFWNPNVGCGEPYYANPQTGLLYPPAWLAATLPPPIAVGVEAGLHLMLLGFGCTVLARRLGARPWLDVAAGWGAVAAGPVLSATGVLNNLDSLAWMPLVCWAAVEGRATLVALFAAASYLAAEPLLTLVSCLIALTIAPRFRMVAALVLAAGLVACQAVPFTFWVRGGDRGPGGDPETGNVGAIRPAELSGLAVPGAEVRDRDEMHFVEDPTFPLWVLVLGGVAILDRRPPVRRLAAWGWSLILSSVLPSTALGLKAWNLATAGLVRYPGRLLFPAVVALAVAAAVAVGARRPRTWVAATVAVAAAVAGVSLGGAAAATLVGAACAGAVLVPTIAAPAALLGAVAIGAHGAPTLDIRRIGVDGGMCLAAQRGAGRIYVVPPSLQQLAWIADEPDRRAAALAWGYSALHDGRRTVRTFAPLQSERLARHLREADVGPAGRWWVDALGARRLVSQHPIAGFPEVCRDGELRVYDNAQAWPEAAIVRALPPPGAPLVQSGEVLAAAGRDDQRTWHVRAGEGGGVFLWLETPDPGWHVSIDGHPPTAVRGSGILQGFPVGAGDHVVVARYRPPGVVAGALVSMACLGVLGGLAWRRW